MDAAMKLAQVIGQSICLAIETDVASSTSVQDMVSTAVRHFGTLDILINNAGFGFSATVENTEENDWDHLMAVNLRRSEEHTSELQSLMSISYDVYCLKKK